MARHSKKLMLQMDAWAEGHCPDKKPRPITPGGRACSKANAAKSFAVKAKQHGTASQAIKSRIRARKAAYNASNH